MLRVRGPSGSPSCPRLLPWAVAGVPVATAVLALLVSSAAAGAGRAGAPAPSLTITTQPAIARLDQPVRVTVRGARRFASLELRLKGATDERGRTLSWVRLRLRRGGWTGELPPLELRGVYAIQLRASGRLEVLQSPGWLLRVFAPGTLSRPAFATPDQVAGWWLRAGHRGAFVVARRWPLPAFDRRDPRLHRLLVVAYRPSAGRDRGQRLGVWLTAVRTRVDGRWRLLEATVRPPYPRTR